MRDLDERLDALLADAADRVLDRRVVERGRRVMVVTLERTGDPDALDAVEGRAVVVRRLAPRRGGLASEAKLTLRDPAVARALGEVLTAWADRLSADAADRNE